jgi:hypothetical protein
MSWRLTGHRESTRGLIEFVDVDIEGFYIFRFESGSQDAQVRLLRLAESQQREQKNDCRMQHGAG